MIIFEKNLKQNRVKKHTKTHQIAPFEIFSRGCMPLNPPSKTHGFQI